MTFPAYPDYRDSAVEWLGVVPEHWGIKPLRYLGRFRKGLTITKADLTDTGIPCLSYGEVHSMYPFEVNQDMHPLRCVPVEYMETDPSACVRYGDFVFADTSEDLDGVGNFTHVSGMEPLFAGYHTIIYSLNSEVSSRFLAYCLESFAFRTQLRMGVKGVKVFSVTQEILRGGIAWLPTTAEQTQIARFLDHETARIDELMEEQQRLIELLKEKRQAVISHAVTKGLDPTVLMKSSGMEWLGDVPAHWSVVPFGLAFGYQEGPGIMAVDFRDEGVPLVRISGVQGRWVTLQGCNYLDPVKVDGKWGHFRLEGGDLIISGSASMGLVSEVGEEAIGAVAYTGLIRLAPKAGISDRDFLRSIVGSYQFFAQIDLLKAGSTIQHFGPTHLSQMKVVLPPLDEQIEVAAHVDRVSVQFDQLLDEAAKANDLLQERRSALISAAVTGKIDVRSWLPAAIAPSLELADEAA